MKHLLSLLFALLPLTADAAYSVVSTTPVTIGSLQQTTYVIQDGTDVRQRFEVKRVRKPSATSTHGAILLFAGSSANFELYEADENGVYANSLAGVLASAGIEVWGYSPRTKGVPANACLTGAFDCSLMAGWGLQGVVNDAAYAKSLIATVTGISVPAIGGWSLGAIQALAVMNADPNWAGAWLFEGLLTSTDTLTVAGNAVACIQNQALMALGQYGGGQTIGAITALNALPEPLRKTALVAGTTLPLQPPASLTPNYTLLKGKLNLLGLVYDWEYTNYQRLLTFLGTFNAYESVVIQRDVTCSIAGTETTFNSNLSSFTAPLLVLKTPSGMGNYVDDTLAALGTPSGQRTVTVATGRAHGDPYAGNDHATWIDTPITNFMTGLFP